MKLSVVIPAFNEEKLLPGCLEQLRLALHANAGPDWSAEVIVCDNNSTDRTPQIARQAGAHVVFEPVNQISRARNAGAAVASGDWLLFIDADSYLHPVTLADLLHTIKKGNVAGGGCLGGLDETPLTARAVVVVANLFMRAMRWAAGSFVFCRAEAFRAIGGFPLSVYAGEEILFSAALARWARQRRQRVVILKRHPHVSSGRKFRLYTKGEMVGLCLRALLRPGRTLGDPRRLAFFYDGRR
jgi:glycosyltransferase involved in cell wall biosynthesis